MSLNSFSTAARLLRAGLVLMALESRRSSAGAAAGRAAAAARPLVVSMPADFWAAVVGLRCAARGQAGSGSAADQQQLQGQVKWGSCKPCCRKQQMWELENEG